MTRMTRMMAVVAAVALACSTANAWVIVQTDCVSLSSTNWADCVTFNKFTGDPAALTKITVELQGHVQGMAKFESLDNAPATVKMNLQAIINLHAPVGPGTLTQAIPVASTSDDVTAYDNILDYGGGSGRWYPTLSGDCTTSAFAVPVFVSPWTAFIGAGTVDLPIDAMGASSGSGAGNLVLQFSTDASAIVTVTYEYVPEPATMTLVGTALLGLVGWRRRRSLK